MMLDSRLKILIVEPDIGLHHLCRLFLRKMLFDKKHLVIYDAYTPHQALAQLENIKDFALIISSSKYKRKDDGLFLLAKIRKDPLISATRILYHIKEGGAQPSFDAIKKLNINCFREIKELTQYNFFNEIYTALGDYRYIIQANKSKGLA